ncbi:MAG: hypothetical protein KJ556_11860 [Gammaproteobacteria bacterium]|nr:hypothetical protein [Gammaproteobacteria bacterium]MBU2059930.1 hypothetical protein [Gammaproteobacteria bacterium]MBU2175815.1 hypothetical protein [Gammaproteobacteria bacterium]MBU2247638.1 hypothetical protein [Gammaproteobacteria bacterium]MBU2342953.1 hypothetical protein [Gammaproteobacteria bacterium]
MKHLPAVILTTLVAFTTNPVFASCENLSCFGKINGFAQSLKVTSEGVFITVLKDVDRKALACELVKGDFIRIPDKAAHFDSMHALLLTAFSSNAEVIVEFDPTKTKCVLDSIELMPAN